MALLRIRRPVGLVNVSRRFFLEIAVPAQHLSEQRHDYTVREFASLTSLSVSTIRRRIEDGTLTAWQPGGPGTRVLVLASNLLTPHTAAVPEKSLSSTIIITPPSIAPARLSGPLPRWKRPQ